MTPVEKMARAIIETGLPSRDFAINPICAEELAVAVPMVRAALEALREPSEGMLMAGTDELDPIKGATAYPTDEEATGVWQAMITAALDEQAG